MTRATIVRTGWLVVAALAGSGSAAAQWSPDAGANLPIGDRSGEQTQPLIAATPDGGCYISWFDNSAGGYDLYLQRLDAAGVEQWPHNGVLVADRGFSSTQGYSLKVDAGGNAVLAYRDDSSGGVQVHASLVAPDGTLLWGPQGVQVSTTSGGNSPHVAATSDGDYVVGWSIGAGFRLQRLDASGAPQWAGEGHLFEPGAGSYTLSELQGADNGSVIALWVRPIGNFLSDKHLYTQKYDANGLALWDGTPGTPGQDPVIVYDGGSVQIGYFPTFIEDGAGGAVFGWYAVSGDRDAYVQHVSPTGVELLPHNGVSASTQANRLQLAPGLGYDPASGEIFLAWTESNANQSAWGLYAQRFSPTGVRQWGTSGVEILPLGASQSSFVHALPDGDGLFVAAQSDSIGTILAARLDLTGAAVWTPSPREACSVISGKSRLAATLSADGAALLAWGDSRDDVRDVYAQNVWPDGSLGPAGCPADLDGNGAVDVSDLGTLLGHFGIASGATHEQGDVNGDGAVDVTDLGALLGAFGATCAP